MSDQESDTAGSSPRLRSRWLVVGAALGGLAVIFGAFGAHGIDDTLVEVHGTSPRAYAGFEVPASYKYLQDYRTGALYHLVHAVAVVCVGAVKRPGRDRLLGVSGWFFTVGITLFSGSLYTLVLTGETWLGAVTPFGGTSLIVGWTLLAVAGLSRRTAG
ncbi:MAG: DUF423 domain-containing protein [Planctomycetota bacterium]